MASSCFLQWRVYTIIWPDFRIPKGPCSTSKIVFMICSKMYSELSFGQTTPPLKRERSRIGCWNHLNFWGSKTLLSFFGPKHVETRNPWESNDPQDQTNTFSFLFDSTTTLWRLMNPYESIFWWLGEIWIYQIYMWIEVEVSNSTQVSPPYVSPHLKWQLPQTSFVRLAVWKKPTGHRCAKNLRT